MHTELILSVSTEDVLKTENVRANEFLLVMMDYNVLSLEGFFGMETMLDKYKIIHTSY